MVLEITDDVHNARSAPTEDSTQKVFANVKLEHVGVRNFCLRIVDAAANKI